MIIDVTGAIPRFTNTRGLENVSLDIFMNLTPGGRGARAAGGIFSWLRNAAGKLFGRKAVTEAVETTFTLTVGTRTTINAAQLRSVARQSLEAGRLRSVRELADPSAVNEGVVKVTRDGVIVSGHHRARAWAEQGRQIEVEVVQTPPGYSVSGSRPILELPVN